MFTDDKMEEAFQKNHLVIDALTVLVKEIASHDGENRDENISMAELRRMDHTWQLWSKRHPEIDKDFFVKWIIRCCPEQTNELQTLFNRKI